MYHLIKTSPVCFPDPYRYGIVISDDCKDFIEKLLEKNPQERLGARGGVDEILNHPWLKKLDRQDILDKKVPAEIIPNISENPFDINSFSKKFTNQEAVHSIIPEKRKRVVDNYNEDFKSQFITKKFDSNKDTKNDKEL